MVATDLNETTSLDESNIFPVDDELSLIKSAAIYGANASGKSNLIQAINFMRWFVLNSSSRTQITDEINVDGFRLSTETINKPSFFEMVFVLNKKIYRYGFELDKKQVISEWLFYTPNIQENKYFERNKQKFNVLKRFSEGQLLDSKTRPNALFLSVVAQFNGKASEQILRWFEKIDILSGIKDNTSDVYTLGLMEDENYREDILQLINKLDLGINDIKTKKMTISLDKFPPEILEAFARRDGKVINELETLSSLDIKTIHYKYDSHGTIDSIEEFYLDENESEGTKKLFAFVGPILHTLREGDILFIDELDARLHPLITKTLVELFNSSETNPNNAQLIFTIHNTNLLTKKLFRQDQIWFVEKDQYGATDLYSLVEYKLSNDIIFEGDYIKGRYGAIPFIGDLRTVMVK